MEYTRGNWYLDCNDRDDATIDYAVFAWIERPNQYPCHIASINHCTLEAEANAHLIAAAPDMYEALKVALWLLRGGKVIKRHGNTPTEYISKATVVQIIKQALAKAGERCLRTDQLE